MYLLVTACVIVLVVLLVSATFWRKDRQKSSRARQREAEVAAETAKVERALAGDSQAEAEIYAAWPGDVGSIEGKSRFLTCNSYTLHLEDLLPTELYEKIRSRCLELYLDRVYAKYFPEIQECHNKWRSDVAQGNFLDAYKAGIRLRAGFGHLEDEVNRTRAAKELALAEDGISVDQLTHVAQEHVQQLWDQAQTDHKAYFAIQSFIRGAWRQEAVRANEVQYHKQPQLDLCYPEGWAQKTAEHLRQPNFLDFAVREFLPGEGLRRAVEVLMYDGGWVEAAIVLAHSNFSKAARQEVGEQLRRELQEKVSAARRSAVAAADTIN